MVGLRRLNSRTQFNNRHHGANLVDGLCRMAAVTVGMVILQGVHMQAADSTVVADMRVHQRRRDLEQHEQDRQNWA